jgi:hypothetical protein
MNRYDKERCDKWASWTKEIDEAFEKGKKGGSFASSANCQRAKPKR